MKWVSTRRNSPAVSFIDALFAGTAPDGGLYFPDRFDPLPPSSLEAVRSTDIVETASIVGGHLLRDEITGPDLAALVRDALDFPIPLVQFPLYGHLFAASININLRHPIDQWYVQSLGNDTSDLSLLCINRPVTTENKTIFK